MGLDIPTKNEWERMMKYWEREKKYEHDPWTCAINLLSLSQFFVVVVDDAHTFFLGFLPSRHISSFNWELVKNKVQREYIFRFLIKKREACSC